VHAEKKQPHSTHKTCSFCWNVALRTDNDDDQDDDDGSRVHAASGSVGHYYSGGGGDSGGGNCLICLRIAFFSSLCCIPAELMSRSLTAHLTAVLWQGFVRSQVLIGTMDFCGV